MRGAERIDWTRMKLQPQEREDLLTHERENMLTALTSEQREHLLEHDYVWVKGSGVLWKHPGGALRRAQFTHGTYFGTEIGDFYIDSDGSVRELLRAEATQGESSHEGETVARPNPGEAHRGRGEDQGWTHHP
jgi:hypothetical protein